MAFLANFANNPDEYDLGNLKHVLKYHKFVWALKLTLIIYNISIVKLCVDTSYMFHVEFRGHTGSMMSLYKVAMTRFFAKQKINGKILTQYGLIGVDDSIPKILGLR